MPRTRSILVHGLGITLRRLPAFLWTYGFSLVLAAAFCFPMKMQLANMLDGSLAAQRLSSGFDVGTAVDAAFRLHEDLAGQSSTMTSHGAIPLYLLVYFILVPGTLFCYITRTHARLSTLLREGIVYFWRFIRITVLTALALLVTVFPLTLLQARWTTFVQDRFVGRGALGLRLAGVLVVLLVASLVRLYFDLVEAYTVQLGAERKHNEKQDRRVRRTLGPAFRLLKRNLFRAWSVFLLLAVIGAAATFFAGRTAMHMLAQPRVWPMFLVAQAGLLVMLFTRFWQRGAEASLVRQHPLVAEGEGSRVPFASKSTPPPPPIIREHPQHVEMIPSLDPLAPIYPAPLSADDMLARGPLDEAFVEPDPIPDPEPAVPSLDEPDPGVFHHEPGKPQS